MKARRPIFLLMILLAALLPIPVLADPGWLTGWGHRVQITIDADDVDTELTYFPVLIKLSDSSGINGTDVTFVFDEVEANSLKIAVTKADGTTELYVEIEEWNNVTEKAYLWVSKSDWVISNTTDTIIYLYYDNEHADNNAQVGVIGSGPGELVWDANFKFVGHLRDETTSTVLDSTNNDKDGTKTGANNPLGITTGYIDGAQDFSNDRIAISSTVLGDPTEVTFEAFFESDVANTILRRPMEIRNPYFSFIMQINSAVANKIEVYVYDSVGNKIHETRDYVVTDYHYVVGSAKENDVLDLYVDANKIANPPAVALFLGGNQDFVNFIIGASRSGASAYFDGEIDEVRVSNIKRSDDWIESTYESERDHLLYFGEEEAPVLEPPNKLFGAGFNASTPHVDLYWSTNLTDITLFEVQNSTDKVSWDYLGQNTTAEYHDFEVVNGTERYYRVRACNYTGAAWDNSTWTDINFEKVYFVMPDAEEAALRPEGWVLTIMIAAIGVPLIILGTRRRRK